VSVDLISAIFDWGSLVLILGFSWLTIRRLIKTD
jgi:hypothetical protein